MAHMFFLVLSSIIIYFHIEPNVLVNASTTPAYALLRGQVIKGLQFELEDGNKIHAFYGIKYGEAERFKRPKKAQIWDSVLNADTYRYACPQAEIPVGEINFEVSPISTKLAQTKYSNEDCLFLNVFRPAFRNSFSLPVMVWIHGGTFTNNTIFGDEFNPKHIVSIGEVIVVTINYRLGAFGFLRGDSDEYPGNLGLYDQRLGLEWVQENIYYFGGDPSQVTIFGESAGAMGISALIVSPLVDGLFHRVILQSGAVNSFIGSETNEVAHQSVGYLAKLLRCETQTVSEMVKCIESKPADDIVNATTIMETKMFRYFGPSYETEMLPIAPVHALLNGNFSSELDLLFGVNLDEGAVGAYDLMPRPDSGILLTVEMVKTIIRQMTKIMLIDGDIDHIIDFYTKDLDNNTDQDTLRTTVVDFYGEYNIVCPVMFFGQQMAKFSPKNKHYAYRLTQPIQGGHGSCEDWMGVCHAMDIGYVFGKPMESSSTTYHAQKDFRLSYDIIEAWTSFAKHGKPGRMVNVEWNEIYDNKEDDHQLKSLRTMTLDANNYTMMTGFFKDPCDDLWRDIMFSH